MGLLDEEQWLYKISEGALGTTTSQKRRTRQEHHFVDRALESLISKTNVLIVKLHHVAIFQFSCWTSSSYGNFPLYKYGKMTRLLCSCIYNTSHWRCYFYVLNWRNRMPQLPHYRPIVHVGKQFWCNSAFLLLGTWNTIPSRTSFWIPEPQTPPKLPLTDPNGIGIISVFFISKYILGGFYNLGLIGWVKKIPVCNYDP